MTQLDHFTRRALSAADQPPPGAEDRILAAILTGFPGGGDGPGGDGAANDGGLGSLGSSAAANSGGGLVYAAKIVGATLSLSVAGLALVAATATGVRSLRPAPRTPTAVVVDAGQAESAGTEAPNEPANAPEPASAPEPANANEPASAPEPASKTDATPPRADAHSKAATTTQTDPSPGLEAELALIQTARSAGPKQALAALDQHRHDFPDGVLAHERDALRVETLCALGRGSEAATLAATFVAANAQHPLRSRVEAAARCEAD